LDGPVEARAQRATAERSPVEVLLLGGRSGVGKTSVGFEVSGRLQAGTDIVGDPNPGEVLR